MLFWKMLAVATEPEPSDMAGTYVDMVFCSVGPVPCCGKIDNILCSFICQPRQYHRDGYVQHSGSDFDLAPDPGLNFPIEKPSLLRLQKSFLAHSYWPFPCPYPPPFRTRMEYYSSSIVYRAHAALMDHLRNGSFLYDLIVS